MIEAEIWESIDKIYRNWPAHFEKANHVVPYWIQTIIRQTLYKWVFCIFRHEYSILQFFLPNQFHAFVEKMCWFKQNHDFWETLLSNFVVFQEWTNVTDALYTHLFHYADLCCVLWNISTAFVAIRFPRCVFGTKWQNVRHYCVLFFFCLSEFQIKLNFNHKIDNKRRNSNIVVSSYLRAQLNFVCALTLTLLFILSERSNHYKRCCDICRRSAACNIHKERKRNTLNDVAVQHITGWTAIWMCLLWSSVYLCLCLCWYVRIFCPMTDARLWRMM